MENSVLTKDFCFSFSQSSISALCLLYFSFCEIILQKVRLHDFKKQLLKCPKIELEMGIAKHYSYTTCLKEDTLSYYSLSHISNKKYCVSRVKHFLQIP